MPAGHWRWCGSTSSAAGSRDSRETRCTSRSDLAGRAWLRPLDLGAAGHPALQGDVGTFIPSPSIAANAGASVFVAWQWPHGGTFYPSVAVLIPAARWPTPRVATLFPHQGLSPVIAADDRGFATVLWQSYTRLKSALPKLQGADLSPRAHVLAVRQLAGYGAEPVIAGDGTSDVVVASSTWTARLRPAGHRWCPSVSLGPSTEEQVAIAPGGVAQVVWHPRLREPDESSDPGPHADALPALVTAHSARSSAFTARSSAFTARSSAFTARSCAPRGAVRHTVSLNELGVLTIVTGTSWSPKARCPPNTTGTMCMSMRSTRPARTACPASRSARGRPPRTAVSGGRLAAQPLSLPLPGRSRPTVSDLDQGGSDAPGRPRPAASRISS